MINYDVEIVPRGAYYQDRLRNILSNEKFKGKFLNEYLFYFMYYYYYYYYYYLVFIYYYYYHYYYC